MRRFSGQATIEFTHRRNAGQLNYKPLCASFDDAPEVSKERGKRPFVSGMQIAFCQLPLFLLINFLFLHILHPFFKV